MSNITLHHVPQTIEDLPSEHAKIWADYNAYIDFVKQNIIDVFEKGYPIFTNPFLRFNYLEFIKAVPVALYQTFSCRHCKSFFDEYSSLFYIDETNTVRPVLFHHPLLGNTFTPYVKTYWDSVLKHPLIAVDYDTLVCNFDHFQNTQRKWGNPSIVTTGEADVDWIAVQTDKNSVKAGPFVYKHFSMELPEKFCIMDDDLMYSLREKMKKTECVNAMSLLSKFTSKDMLKTLSLLVDCNFNTELVRQELEWFYEIAKTCEASPKQFNDAIVVRMIHKRSATFLFHSYELIEKLLHEAKSDIDVSDTVRKLCLGDADTSDPITVELINETDEFIVNNGYESAFRRRHALLSDVPTIWKPINRTSTSAFYDINTKPTSISMGELVTMLPYIDDISFKMDNNLYPFVGLTTACDVNSKPIFKWDTEKRNPISMYCYHGLSNASQMSMVVDRWYKVIGITLPPHLLNTDTYDQMIKTFGNGYILLIDGCKDSANDVPLSLFSETLKPEFAPYARVIDRFSIVNLLDKNEDDKRECQGIMVASGMRITKMHLIVTFKDSTVVMYVVDSL